MKKMKRILLLGLAAALVAVVAVAPAMSSTLVKYRGWTTQSKPNRFHGPVAASVISAPGYNALLSMTLTIKCQRNTTQGYIVSTGAVIDAKGNFSHTPSKTSGTRLTRISGHVTPSKITGSFVATRHGCNAGGKFSARLGTTYPPTPR